ncbi:hypothetical protein [Sphingobium sp.]|uniref:hypothetical protein n=1 Tax=Sphingobium sp. TaxID=1912891 RepID=UPI00082A272B|nr:hypothetical protein [Sphingobium sp.]MBS86582.1 hypothetical protein [Sphingobium sp.]
MSKRPTIEAPYKTLGEWAADRADMRIACVCGRSMNMPAGQILERFHGDGDVASKVIRLRCRGCGRRGHASVSSVPILRR